MNDTMNSTEFPDLYFELGSLTSPFNETVTGVDETLRKCGPFPNDPESCVLLSELRRSAGCFSLVGCTFVIFLIWLLGQWKHCPAQRMIFYLTVSCLVQSLGGILSDPDTDSSSSLCQAQAFLQQLGNWMVMLWVMCIALNVAYNVLGRRKSARSVSFEKVCLAFVTTLSFTMAIIPLGSGAFGHTGGWCWITSDFTAMRFATLYVPLYIVVAVIVVAYVLMARKLRRKSRKFAGKTDREKNTTSQTNAKYRYTASRTSLKMRGKRKRQGTKAARTMLAYPIIFLLLSAFPLINRVYQAFRGERQALLFMAALHAVSIPFLGLANALVYGLNKRTLRALRRTGFWTAFKTRARSSSRNRNLSPSEELQRSKSTISKRDLSFSNPAAVSPKE